jgi:hypothetical protein
VRLKLGGTSYRNGLLRPTGQQTAFIELHLLKSVRRLISGRRTPNPD